MGRAGSGEGCECAPRRARTRATQLPWAARVLTPRTVHSARCRSLVRSAERGTRPIAHTHVGAHAPSFHYALKTSLALYRCGMITAHSPPLLALCARGPARIRWCARLRKMAAARRARDSASLDHVVPPLNCCIPLSRSANCSAARSVSLQLLFLLLVDSCLFQNVPFPAARLPRAIHHFDRVERTDRIRL